MFTEWCKKKHLRLKLLDTRNLASNSLMIMIKSRRQIYEKKNNKMRKKLGKKKKTT